MDIDIKIDSQTHPSRSFVYLFNLKYLKMNFIDLQISIFHEQDHLKILLKYIQSLWSWGQEV